MEKHEYCVCAVQNSRVTFVNGEWQGSVAPGAEDPNQALETCPAVWQYLQEAGQKGWELVSAVNQERDGLNLQTLFLKRSWEET